MTIGCDGIRPQRSRDADWTVSRDPGRLQKEEQRHGRHARAPCSYLLLCSCACSWCCSLLLLLLLLSRASTSSPIVYRLGYLQYGYGYAVSLSPSTRLLACFACIRLPNSHPPSRHFSFLFRCLLNRNIHLTNTWYC